MRGLYRAPRRIVRYSRGGVGAHGILRDAELLQATKVSRER